MDRKRSRRKGQALQDASRLLQEAEGWLSLARDRLARGELCGAAVAASMASDEAGNASLKLRSEY